MGEVSNAVKYYKLDTLFMFLENNFIFISFSYFTYNIISQYIFVHNIFLISFKLDRIVIF